MDDFSDIPSIEFSPDEIERIKSNLGIADIADPISTVEPEPLARRRRRKRIVDADTDTIEREPTPFEPAPLTKRDEREVNERLQSIFLGSTGILALAKPYLQMTDEEAKAISEPLSSYLVRNADTLPIARQVLENYDLLAITLGVMAYVVRVYNDRREEIAERQPKRATLTRLEQLTQSPNERPEVREDSFVSSANSESGRI